MNRLMSLYKWDPSFRMVSQGKLGSYASRVPQGTGIPGWLCLTRDDQSKPIAYWVPRRDNPVPQVFRIVWDERCFEDTILRVEYTPTHVYIADAWMWNGTPLFYKMTFAKRQEFLKSIIPLVYTPCPLFETRKVEFRDSMSDIRGYEHYTDVAGTKGIFIESKREEVPDLYEIVATDIPDVYKVADVGYLRVRTLKLSHELRKLGRSFTLQCVKNEDGTWTPRIDSRLNTNGS